MGLLYAHLALLPSVLFCAPSHCNKMRIEYPAETAETGPAPQSGVTRACIKLQSVK